MERTVAVIDVIIHPNFSEYAGWPGKVEQYDFALLKTEDMGLDGITTDIACLPDQGVHIEPTQNKQCFIAGRGAATGYSENLQSTNVDISSI